MFGLATSPTRLALALLTLLPSTLCIPLPQPLPQDTAYGNNTDPTSLSPDDPHNPNSSDIYGFGVRLGIYFQALAFLIGFANVLRLDPKSQFSGVVIAFTVLVRWFTRLHRHNISAAELWVGLALLLLVSAPGMWLLFFTLEAQRRKWYRRKGDWKAAFAEVTKGQTLNILQALVVFIWTVVANSWFSYWIIGHDHGSTYPAAEGQKNEIWLGKTVSVGSPWVRVVLVVQAVLGTAFTAFPTFVYVCATLFAIYLYWNPTGVTETPLRNTDDELDKQTRMVHKRWAYTFGGFLFILCILLVLSIELTLRNAGLTPEMDVESPGQLLPLIAGSVSCVSSAADAFSRHVPVFQKIRHRATDRPIGMLKDAAGSYIPLIDNAKHSASPHAGNRERAHRDSAVSQTPSRHSRVGSEHYDVERFGNEEFELPRVTSTYRNVSLEDQRQEQGRQYGRNSAYEPFRRLP